jgi:hypothetical protein
VLPGAVQLFETWMPPLAITDPRRPGRTRAYPLIGAANSLR